MTNPTKQLFIDFVYGALLKMKEYNAHTHLEAYRSLLDVFPKGFYFYLSSRENKTQNKRLI